MPKKSGAFRFVHRSTFASRNTVMRDALQTAGIGVDSDNEESGPRVQVEHLNEEDKQLEAAGYTGGQIGFVQVTKIQ